MGSIFRRDGKWAIDYSDHRGRRVRKVVATDKSVAVKILADETAAIEKLRAGMLLADPREGKRPIQEHIEAYLEELRRRGRDAMYVYVVQKRLEGAAFDRDWHCLNDCTAKSVGDYLRALSDDGRRPRTVNQHRSDLSAFFRWCQQRWYLPANPCEQVVKMAVKQEKTRRALSVAECRALLEHAPEERRFVYLFLLYTGLRRAEAAAICWGHIHLDVVNPYVELPACITKSGKAESVPLVPDLAAALRLHRGKAKGRQSVFERIPSMPEFRKDLAAAGIAEEDERGRKVVVHSLRHSLATMLAQSNVPPAVAMKILRHRDIRLTLQAYTDEGLLATAAAMAGLPNLTGGTADRGSLQRQA